MSSSRSTNGWNEPEQTILVIGNAINIVFIHVYITRRPGRTVPVLLLMDIG